MKFGEAADGMGIVACIYRKFYIKNEIINLNRKNFDLPIIIVPWNAKLNTK